LHHLNNGSQRWNAVERDNSKAAAAINAALK
jgi:hypothetical protein